MLSLLACLTFSQTAAKVSMDLPFQTLDSVVAKLSEQSGQSFVVAPNLAREMVRVRVKDVPVDELLTKLAQCAYAEWVRQDGRTRLQRTPAMETKLADAEAQFMGERLRAAVAASVQKEFGEAYEPAKRALALREQVDAWVARSNQPPFDTIPPAERKKRPALRDGAPANRATGLLTQTMDFTALAKMADGDCIVFSTAPRGDQKPFSPASMAVIAQFRRDLAAYAAPLAGWPGQSFVVSSDAASRVTLEVSAQRDIPGEIIIHFNFHAFDDQNREIANGTYYAFTGDRPHLSEIPPPVKFSVTAQTASIEEAYRPKQRTQGPVVRKPIPREIQDILRFPERFPRFAYQWSELVPAIAASPQTNVVANLQDSLERGSMVDEGTVNLSYVRPALTDGHEIVESPAWLVVRPRFPGPAGAYRFNRVRAAQLIRAVADDTPLSLEEVSPIPARDRSIGHFLSHPLCEKKNSPFQSAAIAALFSDPSALEIMGAMEPTLRSRLLKSGGEISWNAFGVNLQQVVERQLKTAEAMAPAMSEENLHGKVISSNGGPSEEESLASVYRLILSQVFSGRTNARGVPASDLVNRQNIGQVRLRVLVKNTPGLVRLDPEKSEQTLQEAFSVPQEVVPSSQPDGVLSSNDTPKAYLYRPAFTRRVTLVLELPGGKTVAREARDWTYDPLAAFVPADKLPSAHLRAIQSARG